MKKVVFFSKNMNMGGMEKSLVKLLNELVKHYEITLILEEKEGPLLDFLNKSIIIKEYKLSSSKNIVLKKFYNLTKRIFWYVRNFHKYDFSCNYATYSIIGSRLAQKASKNNSYYIHSNYYQMYKGKDEEIKQFFSPHNIEKYKTIFFVSNESKELLSEIYPQLENKFQVLNNLIDYENIYKLAKRNKNINLSKGTNILFLGRFDNESKNIELLLNSFYQVIKKDQSFHLYLIGSGPFYANIEEFINNKKLNKNIIIIKETLNPYPYLEQCDSLILTSNYEGFPVVFLEALVLNKQIISTIICSDESLNMEDYVVKVEKNIDDIVNNILNIKNKLQNNKNLDFSKLNEKKIQPLKEVIER